MNSNTVNRELILNHLRARSMTDNTPPRRNAMYRMNSASMAVIWQRASKEQYDKAFRAMAMGEHRKAAGYQRQAARDHKRMFEFLRNAL